MWTTLTVPTEDGQKWCWEAPDIARLFVSNEMRAFGDEWYEHPAISRYPKIKPGFLRIRCESYIFLASLGYEHVPGENVNRITAENKNERVALVAHEGFGKCFISSVLDIPLPAANTHYSMCHTGITIIEFEDEGDGFAIPRLLTLSSNSHIYREGLPTNYCNRIIF